LNGVKAIWNRWKGKGRRLDVMKKIPLIKPYVTEEVKDRVCRVLDSGYLTEGPVTREFENQLTGYLGCRHALAVSNCTVGLEMGLRAMGVGPGDEVIVPDYTYPATAAVVNMVGATSVLVDIDPTNMLIDYDALEKAITPKTKAVMPVSIFGNPLDYDRLRALQEKHGIYVLEDAACSIGARYDGTAVGNRADISVFSFHPRKFITTGEGGAVTTNRDDWAAWMSSYKHFGMGAHASRKGTRFVRIGGNYKLSNVLAAIGTVQMAHIDFLLSAREKRVRRYQQGLEGVSGVRIPETTPKGAHSWQSFCIFVKNRDEIIEKLREKGIETQIGTYALHLHEAFRDNAACRIMGDMAGSLYAFDHCLTLPLYHDMTAPDQAYVVEELARIVEDWDR